MIESSQAEICLTIFIKEKTMKLGRNLAVDMVCERCGVEFQSPRTRVRDGQGKFCSLSCYNIWYKENISPTLRGYEKGKKYWNGKYWSVQWKDENNKAHNTPYPKWWWTLNVGDVPEGYCISYVDNNHENIDPSNFECVTNEYARGKAMRGKKRPHSEETKRKQSIAHLGKRLSPEHIKHMSEDMLRRWASGMYDNTVFSDARGDKNPNWRGGVGSDYPEEFSRTLKKFIRNRDNLTCQICGCGIYDGKGTKGKVGHVHHITGNKNDSSYDNLILLCINCHAAVHHSNTTSPVIMAFRSKLEWND
jgi:hypothetical protein